ncbi:DMT family transporter [Acrocarpospora catenulata]|uniref:DMT family transporter n=1 Tax=Acrocarpospora catenulata TaxID=2836182 RepID=UPI0027E0F50B|nr:DMT family transporter [Acrocarpospora catenulata]
MILALFAALCNAVSSVLQRRAAKSVPEQKALRPALMLALMRDRTWLGGIATMIAAFAFQAGALGTGALAIVQPVLVTELPFTMVILSRAYGVSLGRRSWLAVGTMTLGLAVLLLSAAPTPGDRLPSAMEWALATIGTGGAIALLVFVGRLVGGLARPVAFGVAAGVCFAFTATFIKQSMSILTEDPAALATSWQPYAMVAAGLLSVFLLENALQSGPLVAAQPALTISDPVAGIIYGTTMFGEDIRTGGWILLEAVGLLLIIRGSFQLAQSPPVRAAAAARTGL